jgi:hypothetical protein
MSIKRWDKNWLSLPFIENDKTNFYNKTSLSGDVRKEIRNFMKDVVNVIGPRANKKKYPSNGKYFKIANDMLNNAYNSLRDNQRSISFDFKKIPDNDREYFYSRFQTFIDEIIETKTINEKYLLIFTYYQGNRKIVQRKLLTDDTARSIQRQISKGKFGMRFTTEDDDLFVDSDDDVVPVPSQELENLTIIDLNNSLNNPMKRLHEGSFWNYINLSKHNLERYMIFKKLGQREREIIKNDNCFCYALRQSGKVSNEKIENMKSSINQDCIPIKKIRKISKKFGINLIITNCDLSCERKEYFIWDNGDIIELLLFHKHYMIKDKYIYSLLKKLFIDNLFRPIMTDDIKCMKMPKDEIPEDLDYNIKECCHLKKVYENKR